ncbi:MAG: hypothetical protein AAF628_37880 [Planctomycetota bacterium]
MEETRAQKRVAREDLALFINACFACTNQAEHYSDARGQAVSIGFLHSYVLGNYRRLYARCLAAGINHFNQATIVSCLLRTGKDTPVDFAAEEGALIRAALRGLPPQRVLRLFRTLRRHRVNNRRTRAAIRDWVRSRPAPAFDAVKYRNKLKHAARHAHLSFGDETGTFLFDYKKQKKFETELFDRYREAHFSARAIYDLPLTVAEGFAEKHGVPRAAFLKNIEPRLTAGERLRLQASAERAGGKAPEIDLSRTRLTRLVLYVLSLDAERREARRDELERAIDGAAFRALSRAETTIGAKGRRVAAVLDRSYSSSGSTEKRRRPLGIAVAASALLRQAAGEYRAFWTGGCEDELMVSPRGQTDLATPLLDALEWGADLVVILSDGFENDPPGTVDRVVKAYRQSKLAPTGQAIVHVNPVFDAQNFEPRTLGPSIPCVGVRDAEDLPTMLDFARFVDGSANFEELDAALARRSQRLIAGLEEEGES